MVAGVGVTAASAISSATLGAVGVVPTKDWVAASRTGGGVIVGRETTEGLGDAVMASVGTGIGTATGTGSGTGTEAIDGCDSASDSDGASADGISFASLPASASGRLCR